jgi:hypothetical protein
MKHSTKSLSTLSLLFTVMLAGACMDAGQRDRAPAGDAAPSRGIDEAACKSEAKYQCSYECIETSKSPADRNGCEVECGKRPLSHWDGKIPACTP